MRECWKGWKQGRVNEMISDVLRNSGKCHICQSKMKKLEYDWEGIITVCGMCGTRLDDMEEVTGKIMKHKPVWNKEEQKEFTVWFEYGSFVGCCFSWNCIVKNVSNKKFIRFDVYEMPLKEAVEKLLERAFGKGRI